MDHFSVRKWYTFQLEYTRGPCPKITFAHFFVKKVTKVFFDPSKFAHISGRLHLLPEITQKNTENTNPLYITDFGDMRPKTDQQNRQTDHKNRGKRPTITP